VQEFPAFQEVYNKHQGQFELLSIAVDERANPRDLVKNNGYSWNFGTSEAATTAYNFTAIPYTLFIDSTGKIVESQVGGMNAAEFESQLNKIL